MAGRERGTRDAIAESWFGYDGAEHWELQWDTIIMQKGYSKYGISDFCKVISRSSGAAIEPGLTRVHLCYHNPCRSRWEHERKYGELGFPLHVQLA